MNGSSAAYTSEAEGRAAGSLAIIVMMSASRAAGAPGRRARSDGGGV
jgi:hypothetical protein